MSKRDFKEWLSTFRPSINEYNYYTDFEKVYEYAEKYKTEIFILNSLVNSKNINNDFEELVQKYPECLKCIPILLAVRENEIYCKDEVSEYNYDFSIDISEDNDLIKRYSYFMKETGLFELLANHIISNLFDYVTGVEVGLDSNARKNRGGDQMERLVEEFIKETGIKYETQMELSKIEKRWEVDLSPISANGTTEKVFDFVVKTDNTLFLIEANCYASKGSKLNETARSYKKIAEETDGIENVEFVWITDGGGWNHAKRNLEETFNILDNLYNIKDMENNILEKLFEE